MQISIMGNVLISTAKDSITEDEEWLKMPVNQLFDMVIRYLVDWLFNVFCNDSLPLQIIFPFL